jgi:hypothetical protein
MDFNWFALILVVILPACVIGGMAAVLIRDSIKKRRREKRLHRNIDDWQQLRVD